MKLLSLNQNHSIIVLRNKTELYKKLQVVLATYKCERVDQIMKVCFKHKNGINGIIEKINHASNDLFRPKGWTENEIDLTILTLGIGGRALLSAFSKQNKLLDKVLISI